MKKFMITISYAFIILFIILYLIIISYSCKIIGDQVNNYDLNKKLEYKKTKKKTVQNAILRKEYDNVTITAYDGGSCCCGEYADGYTSTGKSAETFGCAVDPRRIPYNSIIYIPEYGITVTADDTGSAMRRDKNMHIDIRFKTHEQALQFGVKKTKIEVYQYNGIAEK
jgi:3D (Asp-Asp-Asp) domain-containing protein